MRIAYLRPTLYILLLTRCCFFECSCFVPDLTKVTTAREFTRRFVALHEATVEKLKRIGFQNEDKKLRMKIVFFVFRDVKSNFTQSN